MDLKKIRKLLVVILCSVMIVSPNSWVKAEEPTSDAEEAPVLRYTNLSSIGAGLTISSTGVAYCDGSVTMKKNLNCRMYVSLLRSSSSGSYVRINMWAKSFSGVGTKTLAKTVSVSKGYTYKLKVEVRVYNNAGNVIETAEKYSANVVYN